MIYARIQQAKSIQAKLVKPRRMVHQERERQREINKLEDQKEKKKTEIFVEKNEPKK